MSELRIHVLDESLQREPSLDVSDAIVKVLLSAAECPSSITSWQFFIPHPKHTHTYTHIQSLSGKFPVHLHLQTHTPTWAHSFPTRTPPQPPMYSASRSALSIDINMNAHLAHGAFNMQCVCVWPVLCGRVVEVSLWLCSDRWVCLSVH